MHMGIDEARRDRMPAQIDDPGAGRMRHRLADRGDLAVFNQNFLRSGDIFGAISS